MERKQILFYQDGQIDWVLKGNKTYTRLDGTIVGVTDSNGLFTSNLTNSFTDSAYNLWTGLNSDWTTFGGADCANWTDPTSGVVGQYGTGNSIANTFISNGLNSCDNPIYVLCVEQ